MRGPDPRIHDESRRTTALRKNWRVWHVIMDCRVKPGNDSGEDDAYSPANLKAWIKK
jgi:hypothetical protein